MIKRCLARLSYSNVVATLALFLALGGTSYALVVNGALVQDESLTGADVRDGSLTGDDIDQATLGFARVLESQGGDQVLPAGTTMELVDRVTVGSGATASVTATVGLNNGGPNAVPVDCAIFEADDGGGRLLGRAESTLPRDSHGNVVNVTAATTETLGDIGVECWAQEDGITVETAWLVAVVR